MFVMGVIFSRGMLERQMGLIKGPVENQNQCACHGIWKKGSCLGLTNCSCRCQWEHFLVFELDTNVVNTVNT